MDRELGQIERSLDQVALLLNRTAPSHGQRRTRQACLSLAYQRLVVVRAWLLEVLGEEQAELWRQDASNSLFADTMTVMPTIEDALETAKTNHETDKMIVFDGCYGTLTVSPSMAEFLLSRADAVSRRVDEELLPKWLRQRGLEEYMT